MLNIRKNLSHKDKYTYVKRLSLLTKSGLSTSESIEMLYMYEKNTKRRHALQKVASSLEDGITLSESLSQACIGFNSFELQTLSIGEASGTLSDSLSSLAETIENQNKIREKIINAMLYPFIVSIATLSMCLFIFFYIMPKILPVFAGMHVKLPLTTRLLLFMTSSIQHHAFLISLVVAGSAFTLYTAYIKSSTAKKLASKSFQKIPIVGTIRMQYKLSNIARGLHTLLHKNATLEEAVLAVSGLTDSKTCETLHSIVTQIKNGTPLCNTLTTYPELFPDFFVSMIRIGERSGTLSEACKHISEYYDNETAESIRVMSTAVEPLLMLCMGIIVGTLAIAVLGPIYGLVGNMHI